MLFLSGGRPFALLESNFLVTAEVTAFSRLGCYLLGRWSREERSGDREKFAEDILMKSVFEAVLRARAESGRPWHSRINAARLIVLRTGWFLFSII